ncbi:MAG: hypothetical protein RL078_573 [Bacteroidota bacterium]
MTDEQINKKIAEHLGYKEIGDDLYYSTGSDRAFIAMWTKDLNDMHNAESSLNEDQLCKMARYIERNDIRWYFRATARERAEAFLRTLGKWEDGK